MLAFIQVKAAGTLEFTKVNIDKIEFYQNNCINFVSGHSLLVDGSAEQIQNLINDRDGKRTQFIIENVASMIEDNFSKINANVSDELSNLTGSIDLEPPNKPIE